MPSNEAPSFAVVCMARETADVLARFVGHYRSVGAAEIRLYIDGPATPEIAALDAPPRVVLRFLGPEFWQAALGEAAPGLERKQFHVFALAKAETAAPWLLVTDADEYLIARTPVPTMLAGVAANVDAFSIPPVEAVWGPGDDLMRPFGSSWFRRPVHGRLAWALLGRLVYGRDRHFFGANLLGHAAGKHFIRTAARFDTIANHSSSRDGRSVTVSFRDRPGLAAGNEMAHFDAIGFERWREKFARRYSGEVRAERMRGPRRAQVELVGRTLEQGGGAARALFARLHGLTRFQALLMRLTGAAFRLPGIVP